MGTLRFFSVLLLVFSVKAEELGTIWGREYHGREWCEYNSLLWKSRDGKCLREDLDSTLPHPGWVCANGPGWVWAPRADGKCYVEDKYKGAIR